MPGTFVFKPIEAKLISENDFFGTLDPYCTVKLGQQEAAGKICKSGGKNPHWDDSIVVKRTYEPNCTIQIRDKEANNNDAMIGTVELDLHEIEQTKRLTKWYTLTASNNKPAGEILIEAIFAPDSSGTFKQTAIQQKYAQPPSPKTFGETIYPEGLYSPAKQHLLGQRNQRNIAQMAVPSTGLNYVPQVTHEHISHHLTEDEYNKLHGRQNERYQAKTPVVGNIEAPPSWDGYEVSERPYLKETISNLKTGFSPVQTRESALESQPSSQLSYYPLLGGVKYAPSKNGSGYKPVYPGLDRSPLPKIDEKPEKPAKLRKASEEVNVAPTKLSAVFDEMKIGENAAPQDTENVRPAEKLEQKNLSKATEKGGLRPLEAKIPFGEVKNQVV